MALIYNLRRSVVLARSMQNGENTGSGRLSGVFMVFCIGTLATRSCEPRQARKGAAATVDSGAGMLLVRSAALSRPNRGLAVTGF